jgi:hypothetical protein
MKVLTATSRTQGQQPGDFNWCVEGEIVTPARLICGRDRADPDGGCGCGRAFAGLNSQRATTTAVVADLDGYTLTDLAEAVRSYRAQAGWDTKDAALEAAIIVDIAEGHPAGTVLGVRLDDIVSRPGR